MAKRFILFLPVIIFIVLGIFLIYLAPPTTELKSTLINRPLPAFSLPTLHKPGDFVSDKDLRGKPYLINFWGTYCPPCHAEHPFLLELSNNKITIVGISYHDDLELARLFLEKKGNPFSHSIVDVEGRFGINMGVVGPPETFLIDENGIVVAKHIGMLDSQVWSEKFSSLL